MAPPVKIPKEKTVVGLANLKTAELSNSLHNARIVFNQFALKPELQVHWALMKLSLFTDRVRDEKYLVQAIRWCSMLVPELIQELKRRHLQDLANKWTRAETLTPGRGMS
jgi:hypothetical protein